MNDDKGKNYRGTVATAQNFPCLKWSDVTDYYSDELPEGSENYCRNPSGSERLWCYTGDERTYGNGWEYWWYCSQIPGSN